MYVSGSASDSRFRFQNPFRMPYRFRFAFRRRFRNPPEPHSGSMAGWRRTGGGGGKAWVCCQTTKCTAVLARFTTVQKSGRHDKGKRKAERKRNRHRNPEWKHERNRKLKWKTKRKRKRKTLEKRKTERKHH